MDYRIGNEHCNVWELAHSVEIRWTLVSVWMHSTTWASTLWAQSGQMHFQLPLEVVKIGQAQNVLDPVHTCI